MNRLLKNSLQARGGVSQPQDAHRWPIGVGWGHSNCDLHSQRTQSTRTWWGIRHPSSRERSAPSHSSCVVGSDTDLALHPPYRGRGRYEPWSSPTSHLRLYPVTEEKKLDWWSNRRGVLVRLPPCIHGFKWEGYATDPWFFEDFLLVFAGRRKKWLTTSCDDQIWIN